MEPRRLGAFGGDEGFEAPAVAWLAFIAYLAVFVAVDVVCLRTPSGAGRMSLSAAVKQTAFWIAAACGFTLVVYSLMGLDASVGFLQGCMLEYMLSFDNLFVFHLVFAYYCTPEALLYRALHFGIAGAIVLRVLFLALGFTVMSSGIYLFKFIFGAILVWSGVKSASDLDDEGTQDPTNNPFVAWITKHLPVSDSYEPHGRFFVEVVEADACLASGASWDEEGSEANHGLDGLGGGGPHGAGGASAPLVVASLPRLESFEGSSLLGPGGAGAGAGSAAGGDVSMSAVSTSRGMGPEATEADWVRRTGTLESGVSHAVLRAPAKPKKKASLLLLVVVAVWGVDLIFAVDSVASKLAAVSDLFLNCASAPFAMMGLRSLYFVMESLTQTFETLKYGISAVLILIGLKLIFSGWLEVSNGVCFAVILGVLASSVASSYWLPRLHEDCQAVSLGAGETIMEGQEESDDDESGLGPLGVSSKGSSAFERAPLRGAGGAGGGSPLSPLGGGEEDELGGSVE